MVILEKQLNFGFSTWTGFGCCFSSLLPQRQTTWIYIIFCLQKLCPLLFSMNHRNYAKYLSVYCIMLVNLPQQSKDLLQANGFSVSRSDTPASRTAADMTIEQTINEHAKTSGGIVRFSRSLPAYYRWCVTRHNRAQ
ncbi:hypothetical protein PoB_001222700 [Plakobranchus ocellatus]|uniref:Uncharacterized protein n=1 Tax=Plakobranchus ocellatus TaxID=259542 RepID=A0AAV3YTB9_9GAST|nr:hypothetical protein PoB_001222700 [Plakobranchus ocellatus]